MRIIKNIEEPMANFGDLMIGDAFLDSDGSVCMKVPKILNAETESLLDGRMDADNFYDHEANAYDLEKNEFFWLDENNEVRPLNAYMEVR